MSTYKTELHHFHTVNEETAVKLLTYINESRKLQGKELFKLEDLFYKVPARKNLSIRNLRV